MVENLFFDLLNLLEKVGVWLSILAWFTVAGGGLAMACALRRERRARVWIPAAIVFLLALVANLADYFGTLQQSPDLAYEANPLWRNIMDTFGLPVARWYGLTGKLWLSLLAGQMFAFYLRNRHLWFPEKAESFGSFLRGMGNRNKTLPQRLTGLFTLFAFFFAGIQLLLFYVAYLNSLEDPALFDRLPSFPAAVVYLVIVLGLVFVVATYRAFRRSQPSGKN